ncbi:MAG: hypothetical protein E6448_09290 [Actinomyces sp.]|nr:hypothetical protein [Actinomyces sp.]
MVAKEGPDTGIKTFQKILHDEQPSSMAASITSFGNESKCARIIKIMTITLNEISGIMTPIYLSRNPTLFSVAKSGVIRAAIGTAKQANKALYITSLPTKYIFEKANPAREAISTITPADTPARKKEFRTARQ